MKKPAAKKAKALKVVELTMEEFETRFPLEPNTCEDADPIWENANGEGCFFDTHGEQLAFVKKQSPLRVWTVLDNEDVVSGYHFVDRSGYLVSKISRPEGAEFIIKAPR